MLVKIADLPTDFHTQSSKADIDNAAEFLGSDPTIMREEVVFDVPDTYMGRRYAEWANASVDAMPPPTSWKETYLKVATTGLQDYVRVHGQEGLLFFVMTIHDFGHPHQAIRRLVNTTKPFQTNSDNMSVFVRQ